MPGPHTMTKLLPIPPRAVRRRRIPGQSSASLDAYVIPWCEAVGVAAICTELEARDARLTGRYAGGECSGAAKVTRVRQRYDLGRYPIVYAYGDTDEDREMLAIAHEKYYRWHKVTADTVLSSRHPASARSS